MKKNLLCIMLSLFNMGIIAAQEGNVLPLDSNLKVGKLENGLTYFIRVNKNPEKRADFYIAQRVGSMQEDETQRGLAHFLEHMAFNGSKNFPGKSMINYLETIGVKFGTNLNAYTAFDETVYNISNVPLSREGIIDSALLILHDWSNSLLLEANEIDKERGVIREEWRTRSTAQMRMMEKLLPIILDGSKYGQRMPIGDINIINQFKYEELRAYYKKWYRPDLQGIIVVGDVDINQIEAKIQKLFSSIPTPMNPAKREYASVLDNEEPIVAIATDKEATDIQAQFFFKEESFPKDRKNTKDYFVKSYMEQMVTSMLNARFREIAQKEDSPFIEALSQEGKYLMSQTKNAFGVGFQCRENEVLKSFNAILREVERIRRYGFTASEYDRASANYLRSIENAYNERNKRNNSAYVGEIVDLFTKDEPAPGIETEYPLWKEIVSTIGIEEINIYIKSKQFEEKNFVFFVLGIEKDGVTYPTKDEVLNLFRTCKKMEIVPYKDAVKNEPLIPDLPQKGMIIKESKGAFGTLEWELSNGIRVILKPTNFKEDQVLMSAYSPGGTSLLDENEIANIRLLNEIAYVGGYGNFSLVQLNKQLAGRRASVNASVSTYNEKVSGNCSPRDFETMMQLTYLAVTSPREDKSAFKSYMSRLKGALENRNADPEVAIYDSLMVTLYNNHPRSKSLCAEMLGDVDYERILRMQKERFTNLSDFTFIFTGNIDIEKVKPYIEQYIASLPSNGKKEKSKDTKMYVTKGKVKKVFEKEMKTPKTVVYMAMSGKSKYDLETKVQMDALSQILRILYTDKVREEEGGTYGVSVAGSLSNYPRKEFSLMIAFDTNPDQYTKLLPIIYSELDSICTQGPKEKDLNKVKEYMIKKYNENLKENSYWQSAIQEFEEEKVDIFTNYEKEVNALTVESLRKFAVSLFKQENLVEMVMNPVSEKEQGK